MDSFKRQCSGGAMFDILYPNAVNIISVKDFLSFEQQLSELICNVTKNDVLSSISTSSQIHDVLNTLVIYTIENEQKSQKRQHSDDINVVIDFIQNNYSDSISIDDMIQNIHISKYHFIRLFRRIMGTTPYNYLTNYRINKSKCFCVQQINQSPKYPKNAGSLIQVTLYHSLKRYQSKTNRL